MLKIEDAVKIIKKQLTKSYITSGYDFGDKYVFELLSRDHKQMQWDQSTYMAVDKKNGEITVFDWFDCAINNSKLFQKAYETGVLIEKPE